jgi:hypothetical protein
LFDAFAGQGVKAVSKELATVLDASLKLFAFVAHKPAHMDLTGANTLSVTDKCRR